MPNPKPEFKGAIEGYVVNSLASTMWRYAGTMTWDDMMQEAREVFLICADTYVDVEPRHFMALFQTSWRNRRIDLARIDSKIRSIEAAAPAAPDGDPYIIESVGDVDNDGYLATLIRQAPDEVAMVLKLFLNAPTELIEMAATSWRQQGRYKALGNRQVSMWLGLPEGSTPLDSVQEYFGR